MEANILQTTFFAPGRIDWIETNVYIAVAWLGNLGDSKVVHSSQVLLLAKQNCRKIFHCFDQDFCILELIKKYYSAKNEHVKNIKQIKSIFAINSAGNYIFKVNNRNTGTKVWDMFKVNNKDTETTPLP